MTDENQKPEEHEDVSLYQKLADRAAELMQEGRKTVDEALKKASDEISAGGEYTREQADKIGNFLRRDLNEVGKKAQQARDAVIDAVEPHRVVAGMQSGLAKLLKTFLRRNQQFSPFSLNY